MNGLYLGDCLNVLKELSDNSVDSIVTDPPYGLSFMGRKWDYDVPSIEVWQECLRVLKPGGHLLAFAGTRTQHRMAVRIEDAGFEIRDMIAWIYGSGFPKSLDVSKAIDKEAGAEREVIGQRDTQTGSDKATNWKCSSPRIMDVTAPATDDAKKWNGWGTALKPALEPLTVARKPLIGTVAANVLEHGTGAINIDGCRIQGAGDVKPRGSSKLDTAMNEGWARPYMRDRALVAAREAAVYERANTQGRWPANIIHDGGDETTGLLGNAARFFYCAKASKRDRDEGLEGFTPAKTNDGRKVDADNAYQRGATLRANTHPTVKPTDLMRYLCRLVTPPGGVVLDPFMGSGSTGKAAKLEGFGFIGIERELDYFEIAKSRIAVVTAAGEGMV